MTAEESLKHHWLCPSTKSSKRSSSSSVLTNDSDLEIASGSSGSEDESRHENFRDEKNAPTCGIQVQPPTPTPLVVIKHPLEKLKRPSLDIPKNRLKDFVNQWTDNPYIFDCPRGIITNVSSNENLIQTPSRSHEALGKSLSDISQKSHSLDPDHDGANIVYQIRRFSQQFAEEFMTIKGQNENNKSRSNSSSTNAPNARKCSWSDSPA